MSGFNIGNTFSQRNIFGGSEQLEVKLRYGVLFDPRLAGGFRVRYSIMIFRRVSI
ncbi:hypothetical protein KUH03_06570 [Sphingobacterium sp. E70]|uniref:hypothetical protein n=1 Tax=Sphingobacterium sp. E70 TaxID=2853439 RepID=UPI00211B7712|nr:hypothetical protein [Sphingobacterium sp. E70]ULT26522.1 hypothetical protein KUH03_06570 [Sphingobacterium sp. E70]